MQTSVIAVRSSSPPPQHRRRPRHLLLSPPRHQTYPPSAAIIYHQFQGLNNSLNSFSRNSLSSSPISSSSINLASSTLLPFLLPHFPELIALKSIPPPPLISTPTSVSCIGIVSGSMGRLRIEDRTRNAPSLETIALPPLQVAEATPDGIGGRFSKGREMGEMGEEGKTDRMGTPRDICNSRWFRGLWREARKYDRKLSRRFLLIFQPRHKRLACPREEREISKSSLHPATKETTLSPRSSLSRTLPLCQFLLRLLALCLDVPLRAHRYHGGKTQHGMLSSVNRGGGEEILVDE